MAKLKKATVKPSSTLPRPPVVTIMGHVDHGKTSLLDYIRSSHVTKSEHGGITQHIGAYRVQVNGQAITFIDTPGHAAFAKMRARGAKVTDIVVLVVAANDGVKPQTIESIRHIKQAKVPFIVAINKMDLDSANPQTVKGQLAKEEVLCEGFGGQVPSVNLSAKTGQGVPELLEMILLVAQMSEIKSDPQGEVEAVIIESNLDKHRGIIATAIVRSGTLKTGAIVYLDDQPIHIRQLLDEHQQPTPQALPGQPVVILGFKKVLPPVGCTLKSISHLPASLPAPQPPKLPQTPPASVSTGTEAETEVVTEEVFKPHFNLLIKADMAGTLEAIINNLAQDEITIVDKGIGPINESDVLLAADTEAIMIGFNIPVTPEARRLIDREHVRLKTFSIIYELLEYLEEKVLELLEPTIFEQNLSSAQVTAVFNIRGEIIAGCQVTSGKLTKGETMHVLRRDRVRHTGRITSIKQGKTSTKVAKAGEDCGVVIDPQFDFRTGDVIKSYRMVKK